MSAASEEGAVATASATGAAGDASSSSAMDKAMASLTSSSSSTSEAASSKPSLPPSMPLQTPAPMTGLTASQLSQQQQGELHMSRALIYRYTVRVSSFLQTFAAFVAARAPLTVHCFTRASAPGPSSGSTRTASSSGSGTPKRSSASCAATGSHSLPVSSNRYRH
jgi:hypothetical protein